MPRALTHLLLTLALGCPLSAGAVPAFSLKQLDGTVFRMADHLNKQVIVLDFWATWCGPCTKSLKKLQELQVKYPQVLVAAVATDDGRTMAQVEPYVRGRGFTFTVLLDPEANVCRVYNPGGGIPYTVVIDRQGAMAYEHSGYLPGDELALFAAVAKLHP
jgi:thiol-disulfide isomerase/thioredoxin